MANNNQLVVLKRFYLFALSGILTVLVAGCSDSNLPEYDENATYNGKPLSDYSAGLSDLNARQRLQALYNVSKFGVNGLPVREQVTKMAMEDDDRTVRVAALGTLEKMKDPDLPDLISGILADPNYGDTPRVYGDIIKGMRDVFSDEALAKMAGDITGDNLEHAKMLFKSSPNSTFGIQLAGVLLNKDPDPATLQQLVQVVPRLSLSDDEKIDFLVNNSSRFANASVAINGLRAIGGDKAFDAAVSIIKGNPAGNLRNTLSTISSFGKGIAPEKIIAVLAGLAGEEGRSETDLQQIFSTMGQQLTSRSYQGAVTQGKVDDPAYQEFANVSQSLITEYGKLIQSPNSKTRALAALYMIQGAAGPYTPAADTEKALTSVLDLLETEQEEVVIGTILQQLQQRIGAAKIAPESNVPQAFAEAVYSRPAEDKWVHNVADGTLKAITALMNTNKLDQLKMVRLLTDQANTHKGHPASAQLFDTLLATTRNRYQAKALADNITEIAGLIGALALDSAITEEHIHRTFASSNPGNLTIATQAPSTDAIIAFMNPIVMSQDPKFSDKSLGSKRMFEMILGTNIYYLRQHADQPKYVEWVKKVAKSGHPNLKPIADKGLKQYKVQ